MDENNNQQEEQYEPGHFIVNTQKRFNNLTTKQKIALGIGVVAALGGVVYIRRLRKDVDHLNAAVEYMLLSTKR